MEFKYRLLGVSVATLCMYLIGSFIAWDLNPMNWWLFTLWSVKPTHHVVWVGCKRPYLNYFK
jgi:hypothetical protein